MLGPLRDDEATLLAGDLSEMTDADDPAKFHAVEECGAALRRIAEQIAANREREKLGGNQS